MKKNIIIIFLTVTLISSAELNSMDSTRVSEASNSTPLNSTYICTPLDEIQQPINTQSNLPQNNLVANCTNAIANCKAESRDTIKLSDLLPDDIVSPSRWQDNPINPNPIKLNENDFLNKAKKEYIRKRQFYRPASAEGKQDLIVFITVHGGWQKDFEIFHKDIDQKDKKLKGQVYNHIKKLAAFYATKKEKNLELLSLRWTGGSYDGDRTDAGIFLKNLICDTLEYRKSELVFLGHSHGCNVINDFTNRIEKPIDMYLIYFGCPRIADSKYQPKHYKVLLYFHSDSDCFTVAGRNHEKTLEYLGKLKFAGTVIGGAVGFCFGGLPEAILGSISGLATGGSIAMITLNYRIKGDNHFPEVDDAITVGFRTKLNAWNASHGGLLQVIKFLPKILDKLMDNYRLTYLKSANFHLNIDTKCDSSKEDPINLVIFKKQKNKANMPPEKVEIISLKTLELEYDFSPLALKRDQEIIEDDYSEKEREAYKNKYKKDSGRSTVDIECNCSEELSMK
ncbi:MAG: hypothetical protein ACYCU5_16875 [Actinomycetes bacterium]